MASSGGVSGTFGNKQYANVDTADRPPEDEEAQGRDEEASPSGLGKYTAVSTTSPAYDEKKYIHERGAMSSLSVGHEERQVAVSAEEEVNI